MNAPQPEKFISTKEASDISGYNPDHLSRLVRFGEIGGVRVGRTWHIERESLAIFLQKQGRPVKAFAGFLSASEASKKYGYGADYLARLARIGELKGSQVGRTWLIDRNSLEAFFKRQSARKEARARALANSRTLEYKKRLQPRHSFTPSARRQEFASASPFFKYAAGAVALAVITLSALAADVLIPSLAGRIALTAKDTAVGFGRTFGSIHARIAAKVGETRTPSGTRFHLVFETTDIRPLVLARPDLSALHMDSGEAWRISIGSHPPAYTPHTFTLNPYTLAVSARDALSRAPQFVSDLNLALGSLVINAAHAAIRADVSLAYGLSHAAPESARTLVTFLGDTGDTLARITSRTPALAASFFLNTAALPSELAPGIAQAVFDVEYEGAERFLALAGTAAHASLASFSATARLAHDSLAFLRAVPPALDDAYLGALGKGALALDKATSPLLAAVLPKLSYAEQLALATYETIHGFFDSANRMLALLLGPPPTIVLSTTPPTRSALTILSASSTPTTYTTIVQGISSSFLDQSLATLRADIIATVVGMVNPVAAEVNPIYRYSEARPFDGGAIANSITSPSFSASEADGTSSFALLSAGTTTVTNLTVSNTSTSTFAGPLTTSRFLSSTLGSAASPAFTFLADTTTGLFSPAASTLALSTAGAERLRIDADGNIGIGTTSPDALLSLQQVTNGTPFVSAYRVTDTVPSGDFISYKQNDGTTLFRVDNSGNLLAGGIINSGSQTITSASTPQFRIQYDPSNEITFSTGLTGTTTIGLTGSSPGLVLTPQSNSTNSFNFTDAASDSVLSIDTVNKRVGVGTEAPTRRVHIVDGTQYGFGYGEQLRLDGSAMAGANMSFYTSLGGARRNWLIGTDVATAGDFGFVRSASPGTDPISSLVSLVINNAGNVGVGTSSPGELLDIAGNIKFSGVLKAAVGSASAPSLAFASDPDTGWYRAAANQMGLTLGGVPISLWITPEAGSGGYNQGFGQYTFSALTTGEDNTAFGYGAQKMVADGSFNTAFGYRALQDNVSGISNTAFGQAALQSNTGSDNTAVGKLALQFNTIGIDNTAVGSRALGSNTEGSYNTAMGVTALNANTTGSRNSAFGRYAMRNTTTGGFNVALGFQALDVNTGGGNNTALGYSALLNTAGSGNIGIGYYAGAYETSSNTFYVNNQDRTNTAGDRSKSIIYGVMAADPANQFLTFNANVGIGTTTPDAKLQVFMSGSAGEATRGLSLLRTPTSGSHIFHYLQSGQAEKLVFSVTGDGGNNASPVSIEQAKMVITAAGNVGIGSTTPNAALGIKGNSAAGQVVGIQLEDIQAVNWWRIANNAGVFTVNRQSTTPLVIDISGNVGIGTTSPYNALTVQSTNSLTAITAAKTGAKWVEMVAGSLGTGVIFDSSSYFTIAASASQNNQSPTDLVRVTATGDVGVGTTSPAFDGLSVERSSGIASVGVARTSGRWSEFIAGSVGTGIVFDSSSRFSIYTSATQNNTNNATELISITSGGNVGIGTTTPQSKLSVVSGTNGILNFPSGNWAAQIYNQDDTSTSGGLVVGNRWQDNTSTIFEAGSLYGDAGSVWTSRFIVKGLGNVGIGTTSPTELLSVSASSGLSGYFSGSVGIGIRPVSAYGLYIGPSVSTGLAIAFGTTTPTIAVVGSGTITLGDDDSVILAKDGGSVGVGTSNAQHSKLNIVVAGNAESGAVAKGLVLENSASVYPAFPGTGVALTFTTPSSIGAGLDIGHRLVGQYVADTYNGPTDLYIQRSTDTGAWTTDVAFGRTGLVGIGTSSPANGKLEVLADMNAALALRRASAADYTGIRIFNDQNSTARALEIDYSGSAYATSLLTGGPTGESASIGTTGAYPLAFGTNNTARMTITSTGNVGIGTTSPEAKLHLVSSTADDTYIKLDAAHAAAGTAAGIIQRRARGTISAPTAVSSGDRLALEVGQGYGSTGYGTAGGVVVLADGTPSGNNIPGRVEFWTSTAVASDQIRMTIKSDGNVGIGTTTPWGKLGIKQQNNSVNGGLVVERSDTLASGSFYIGSDDNVYIQNGVGGYLIVNNSGNVGINTSDASGGKLVVKQSTNSPGGTLRTVRYDTTGYADWFAGGDGNAYVQLNGSAYCGTTGGGAAWACSSDERLKDISGEFTRGLADITKIDPINFTLKSQGTSSPQQSGFRAQNILTAIPEAVSMGPDGYYAISDRPIVAASVNAIKELNARTSFIQNTATSTVMVIDISGLVGIGTTTPSRTLDVAGDIGAISFVNTSTRSLKTDVSYVSASSTEDMLNRLLTLKVATYRYSIESKNAPLRLGFIAEDAQAVAPEILSIDGKGVDLYKLATFTLSGVQALAAKLDAQNTRLTSLEARVAALESGAVSSASGTTTFSTTTLASALESMSGILHIKELITDTFYAARGFFDQLASATVTVGSMSAPSGITLYDTVTKQPYCLTIANGISNTTPGVCTTAEQPADTSTTSFATSSTTLTASTTPLETSTVLTGQATTTTTTTATSTPSSDTTAPVVTLNGSAALAISQGSSFTDPGATASDDTDGDLTAHIAVSGTVDTATAGLYTLTYSATDAAGNTGSASRVVTVADATTSSSGSTSTTDTTSAPATDTTTTSPTTTDTTTTSTDTTAPAPAPAPAPEPTPSA